MPILVAQIIVVALVLFAPSPSPSANRPAPQPKGTIPPHGAAFITTLPPAANVWIDGAYVGQTPLYVDELDPGRHTLLVSRTAWRPLSGEVSIEVGRVSTVSFVLTRSPTALRPRAGATAMGKLNIRGGPSGAIVFVDGAKIGKLPMGPFKLPSGHHILELVTPPAGSFLRDVEIYPDAQSVISLSKNPSGAGSGADDTLLAPLDGYIPASGVSVAGDAITIHYRGVEAECEIGSRTYTLNGRSGALVVPPAIVGGKIYLPVSLLKRITGASR